MGKMHDPGIEPTPEQRKKGHRNNKGNEYKKIPCPNCGEPQGNLPRHLPCDGGGDDGE